MNIVKEKLQAGETVIGTTASANSETAFLANSGFDFLLFDTQHSTDDIKGLRRPLASMRGKPAIPILRVGDNRPDQICYALDIGAKGIIVPMVSIARRKPPTWCNGVNIPLRASGAQLACGVNGANSKITANTWTR